MGEFVIDGGFISKEKAGELAGEIERLGYRIDSLTFIITHHHIDHIGILLWYDIRAIMHPSENEFLLFYTNPQHFVKPYLEWSSRYGIDLEMLRPLAEFFRSGSRVKGEANSLKKDFRIEYETPEGMEIIHTPGHSPGHICIYIPKEKILFSGDLVLSVTTTHIGYYPGYGQDPVGDQIESLRKLLSYEIDEIYPAHEDTIKNAEQRIHELIEHYENRLEEVYSGIDGICNVIDVAKNISWSAGSFEKLDGWNRVLAISETLAFLKRLVKIGRVGEKEIEGVVHFTRS
ncbi:MBL fold metallo-hydrolase [Archaeoglobus sulfaticallidus]|nr:MBL fold metallo-hydrolase [Archaeoglobus sulfaticallidus]